jgi:hypothetical protein
VDEIFIDESGMEMRRRRIGDIVVIMDTLEEEEIEEEPEYITIPIYSEQMEDGIYPIIGERRMYI